MPFPVKSLIISWRTIALSLLLSVVVGLAAVSEPIDRVIEAAIGRVAWRPVSDDVVVVALDDRTLDEVAGRDFSMTRHAQLVEAVDRANAKRLFIDFTYDRRERDPDFPLLTAAVKKMGDRAILAVAAKSARSGDSELARFPSPAFGTAARIACIGWEYELWQVWRIPITLEVNGRAIPSFSSLLANRRSDEAGVYALDYSYKTSSITEYSASDVLSGKISRELAGRDVIFAPTAAEFQDNHYLPGHDRVPGAYVHVIGAETLKRGMPVDIGWLPHLALTAVLLLSAAAFRRARWFNIIAATLVVVLIVSKIYLMTMLVSSSIGAALFLAAVIGANISRTSRRRLAQRENPLSGLPNFEALRSQHPFGSATVIAAKVVNFEDLAAFIPGDGIGKLVEQVTRRLQLASQGTTLHHDLDGTFAWLC